MNEYVFEGGGTQWDLNFSKPDTGKDFLSHSCRN